MEEINESSVNAEPVENVVDSQETEQDETADKAVNAEKEETAIPQADEKPVQDTETNKIYAKIRKEAEAKAKDEAIAEMGMEWNGKPITTYAQYKQALNEKAEYDRRKSLQDQGIDPKVVDQYVNENPTVKKAQELIEKQEIEEFKQQNQIGFLDWFKEQNGREYDAAKDIIPAEVWQQSDAYEKSKGREGKSLVDAYAKYENQLLKKKLAEYEKGQKAAEVNKEAATGSTGSVTGNGTTPAMFTRDQVKTMTQKEVDKNYDAIMQSMKYWK